MAILSEFFLFWPIALGQCEEWLTTQVFKNSVTVAVNRGEVEGGQGVQGVYRQLSTFELPEYSV